jgi:hypothetical protein
LLSPPLARRRPKPSVQSGLVGSSCPCQRAHPMTLLPALPCFTRRLPDSVCPLCPLGRLHPQHRRPRPRATCPRPWPADGQRSSTARTPDDPNTPTPRLLARRVRLRTLFCACSLSLSLLCPVPTWSRHARPRVHALELPSLAAPVHATLLLHSLRPAIMILVLHCIPT